MEAMLVLTLSKYYKKKHYAKTLKRLRNTNDKFGAATNIHVNFGAVDFGAVDVGAAHREHEVHFGGVEVHFGGAEVHFGSVHYSLGIRGFVFWSMVLVWILYRYCGCVICECEW